VFVCEEFVIERLAEHGGNVTFSSYEELEAAFADKVLLPRLSNSLSYGQFRDYIVTKNPNLLSYQFVSRYRDIVDPAGRQVGVRREVAWGMS